MSLVRAGVSDWLSLSCGYDSGVKYVRLVRIRCQIDKGS